MKGAIILLVLLAVIYYADALGEELKNFNLFLEIPEIFEISIE